MGLPALSPEDISAPPGKMICKTAGTVHCVPGKAGATAELPDCCLLCSGERIFPLPRGKQAGCLFSCITA